MQTKKNVIISVIIPLFNSEKYLKQLLLSLQHQTFEDFEVLLIDDGSTDNSSFICKKIEENDGRFIYRYQENKGASSARNLGINLSQGSLIMFIDSDDTINRNYLASFYHLYEQSKSDFIFAPVYAPKYKHYRNINESFLLTNNKEILDSYFKNVFGSGPFSKLFKAIIVKKIRFNEDLIINEDKLFLFLYLSQCNTAYIYNKYLYFYNHHSNSLSQITNLDRKVKDMLYVYNEINSHTEKISFSSLKQHNINYLLYIYKTSFLSNGFKMIDDSLFKYINEELTSNYKTRGKLLFRTFLEYHSYKKIIFLYNFMLKKYYKNKLKK